MYDEKFFQRINSEILPNWDLKGEITEVISYGEGHINDTFRVNVKEEGKSTLYILQRINTGIFKNPDELMENIVGVTEYLRKQIISNNGDPDRETMTVIKTKTNKVMVTDVEGRVWRLYLYVVDTVSLQIVEKPKHFYETGYAFGNFQYLLIDYPAEKLHETIPKFHDTVKRFDDFLAAVKTDKMDRAKDVQPEIEFLLERKDQCGVLHELLDKKEIPLRVTHNDTKLNNVLLDVNSEKAVCVIDLDTVMPGISLHDYGDSIRYGANNSAEDERDLSKVNLSLSLFETYTEGFLDGSKGILTETEIKYLPWGARLMTLECGIRFLTDHLQGDTYFKINRENHNLDRCRTQFKLVSDMEKHENEMMEIINKLK